MYSVKMFALVVMHFFHGYVLQYFLVISCANCCCAISCANLILMSSIKVFLCYFV